MHFAISAIISISGVASYKFSSGFKSGNCYFILDLINPKVKLKINRFTRPEYGDRLRPIGTLLQKEVEKIFMTNNY